GKNRYWLPSLDFWERADGGCPDPSPLIKPELFDCGIKRLASLNSGAPRFVHTSLRCVGGSYHFTPLAYSYISVERNSEERQPFHQEPYPVAPLGAVALGMALGLYGFWLLQYSDNFLLGLLFLVIGLCVFICGLDGLFD